MTRKKTAATAALAIMGAAGLAYASDNGNPLQKLALAVQQVQDNTLAIANQTSNIAKETTTVVQQNATIANETAALAQANVQLDQKLDAVLSAISKIEAPAPAPSAALPSVAHTVWLAPYVNDFATSDRLLQATTYVLNAGAVPAKFSCHYFNDEGTRLLHHQSAFTIEPGAIGTCEPKSVTPMVNIGWHLIVSDNPVVVTGKNERRDGVGTYTTSENMPLRPIDCSGDQTGIERACDEVEKIEQGK